MNLLLQLQRAGRYLRDLVRHCVGELMHDRATDMAAALTYRTIFGLIPLFVMALLVFNAFGGFKALGPRVQETIFSQFGLTSLVIPGEVMEVDDLPVPAEWFSPDAPAAPATQPQAAARVQARQEIRANVEHFITQLTEKAQSVSLGSVGVVGLVLLIWAALGLIISLEDSFNRIFDCPRGRGWHLRIPIYWASITLGPVLVIASLSLTGVAVDYARGIPHLGPLLGQATRLGAFVSSWLLLFLLYFLLPNTRVRLRPALVGSFVTAILYECGKGGFQLYVQKVVPYSKVYGSLGLVPLFLFWVYVTWLIVLFGLELTHTLQSMKTRQFRHLEARRRAQAAGDPLWILPIMVRIAQGFAAGRPAGAAEVAGDLGLPGDAVGELMHRLEGAGLLHRVQQAREEAAWSLALPADRIALSRLLELARSISTASKPSAGPSPWSALDPVFEAQVRAAGDRTLAQALP